MQLQLSIGASGKEKYISGAAVWHGSAAQSWLLNLATLLLMTECVSACDDIIARNEKKVKV